MGKLNGVPINFHTAPAGEPPHVVVFTVFEDGEEKGEQKDVIANFYILPGETEMIGTVEIPTISPCEDRAIAFMDYICDR